MLNRSGFALPARTTSAVDWADMLQEHFVALDVADIGDSRFTGSVRSQSIAHLKVSSVDATSQRIERNSTLIDSDGCDFLQLGLIRRGEAIVRQDDRECVLGRGDFAIYDTSRPFDWIVNGDPNDDQWSLEVFTWPRALISLTEHESAGLTAVRFDGRSGMSGVLGRFLHDLATARSAFDSGGACAVADEVGDLVSVIARTTLGSAPAASGRSLMPEIDRFIEDNLADPDLTPTAIATAMLISTRQLHRLFAESRTTLSRSIRVRRLEKCRRDIIASVAVDRSLGQIARRWGFTDLTVFSRAFKEQYGVSPRQYRAAAADRSGDVHAVTRPQRPGDQE